MHRWFLLWNYTHTTFDTCLNFHDHATHMLAESISRFTWIGNKTHSMETMHWIDDTRQVEDNRQDIIREKHVIPGKRHDEP